MARASAPDQAPRPPGRRNATSKGGLTFPLACHDSEPIHATGASHLPIKSPRTSTLFFFVWTTLLVAFPVLIFSSTRRCLCLAIGRAFVRL